MSKGSNESLDINLQEDIEWCIKEYRSVPGFLEKLVFGIDDDYKSKKTDEELERIGRFDWRRARILYYRLYEESSTLYRGLSINELCAMRRYGTLGGGKSRYSWVNLTIDKRIAIIYACMPDRGVLIAIPKSQLDGYVVHSGYDISGNNNPKTIDESKSLIFFGEQEHRLAKNKIRCQDVDMKIIFIGIPFSDQDRYTREFEGLGKIKFMGKDEAKKLLLKPPIDLD